MVLESSKETGIKVRLESGQIVTILPYVNYHKGQSLLIGYDYTKKGMLKIISSERVENTPQPIKIETGDDDYIPEEPALLEILNIEEE